jgi:hypothetical protein
MREVDSPSFSLSGSCASAESLVDVAARLRAFLLSLGAVGSRRAIAARIDAEPARFSGRFPCGEVADAWLAACAEIVARRVRCPPPPWSLDHARALGEPMRTDGSRAERAELRNVPHAFRRRNLVGERPVLRLRSLRCGRPRCSRDHKLRAAAERQRRFRLRRAEELRTLRALAAAHGERGDGASGRRATFTPARHAETLPPSLPTVRSPSKSRPSRPAAAAPASPEPPAPSGAPDFLAEFDVLL